MPWASNNAAAIHVKTRGLVGGMLNFKPGDEQNVRVVAIPCVVEQAHTFLGVTRGDPSANGLDHNKGEYGRSEEQPN